MSRPRAPAHYAAGRHAASLRRPTGPHSARLAWSDQIVTGARVGSEHHPRGVTAILRLQERGLGG